jgi:hypothetical protein
VTDGSGALILVSAERARFSAEPVYLIGTGESVETPTVSQMQDFTSSRAFRVAGPKAFAEAGITVRGVDHLMIYDVPCSLPGEALRICRSMASRIWVFCRAARPAPLSPSAIPPPAIT